jgi:hypothetical protein
MVIPAADHDSRGNAMASAAALPGAGAGSPAEAVASAVGLGSAGARGEEQAPVAAIRTVQAANRPRPDDRSGWGTRHLTVSATAGEGACSETISEMPRARLPGKPRQRRSRHPAAGLTRDTLAIGSAHAPPISPASRANFVSSARLVRPSFDISRARYDSIVWTLR